MIRPRGLGYLQLMISVFSALAQNAQAQVKPADPQKVIRNYFSDQLKDPDSAHYQWGDLYYCRDGALSSLSIQGTQWAMDVSVNAKNSFGGYVGYQGYLMLFDGDRVASAYPRYLVGSILAAACSHAHSLAAAPSKSHLFSLPKLPTAIENTDCNMGVCYYEQITGIDDVQRRGSELLRAIHSRSTEGDDYASVLHSKTWKKSTSYVLCSMDRPTAFWWDDSTKSYLETHLDILSPSHFEQSAVIEYMMACHGAEPGSDKAKQPADLGYVNRINDVIQTHIADPKQIFHSTEDRPK
jgi:hypothetical protein